MAKHMVDRSTYWVVSGGSNPTASGDYRYFWKLYYDTDATNRRTKFTVDYYLQTHCTDYTANSIVLGIPAGKSIVYKDGSSIGSVSTAATEVNKGDNWKLKKIGSKTFNVSHKNDGSASFKFQGSGFGKSTAVSTYSTANGDFPKVPSQSTLGTIETFNIDEGVTIPITTYVTSYYCKLDIMVGDTIFKSINGIENNQQVVFTEDELNNIYRDIPTGETATFTFLLTTYSNDTMSTTIGTNSKTAVGNFNIVLPTLNDTNITYYDKNDVTFALTNNRQSIIKNSSQVVIEISKANEAKANTRGATISHYVIEGVSIPYNTNGISYDFGTTDKSYVLVQAVDSRGTSSLLIQKVFTPFIDYNPVTKNDDQSYSRNNSGVGPKVTISFSGTWWQGNFGNLTNTLKATYKFKKTQSEEYVTGKTALVLNTSTEHTFSCEQGIAGDQSDNGFDVSETYDIIVIVEDGTGSSVQYVYSIHAGVPAIALYKNKAALGDSYDETLGGTQLWNDVYLNGIKLLQYPIGSVYIGSDNTDPKNIFSGTWELIDKEFKSMSTTQEGISMNSTNVSSNGSYVTRSGHTIAIEVYVTLKKAMTDDTLQLLTLNLATLGVREITNAQKIVGYSDGGNAAAFLSLSKTGVIAGVDLVPESSIPIGENVYGNYTTIIEPEDMLDEACDKFYWKRIG